MSSLQETRELSPGNRAVILVAEPELLSRLIKLERLRSWAEGTGIVDVGLDYKRRIVPFGRRINIFSRFSTCFYRVSWFLLWIGCQFE